MQAISPTEHLAYNNFRTKQTMDFIGNAGVGVGRVNNSCGMLCKTADTGVTFSEELIMQFSITFFSFFLYFVWYYNNQYFNDLVFLDSQFLFNNFTSYFKTGETTSEIIMLDYIAQYLLFIIHYIHLSHSLEDFS